MNRYLLIEIFAKILIFPKSVRVLHFPATVIDNSRVLSCFKRVILLNRLRPIHRVTSSSLNALLVTRVLIQVSSAQLILNRRRQVLRLTSIVVRHSNACRLTFNSSAINHFHHGINGLRKVLRNTKGYLKRTTRRTIISIKRFSRNSVKNGTGHLFRRRRRKVNRRRRRSISSRVNMRTSISFYRIIFYGRLRDGMSNDMNRCSRRNYPRRLQPL